MYALITVITCTHTETSHRLLRHIYGPRTHGHISSLDTGSSYVFTIVT